ncbi:hypothetical protein [Flagellimonas nanhaiensis]|uniref:DUF1735 domain-containing protein n=1 Tax=Flagellimonas nanhaiensis TaxID=2292706 RepID=A0A371JS54_9FLAO|nr:hypothetical protein [Allomuricauda nanhaiensis]RDY60630.1 hypothetical protein DX873_00155 [Allomuricauda nanhaiensis]
MKNLKLYFMFALGMLIVSSCSEDDKITNEVVDATTRGAVIRTVNIDPNSFNVFDPSSVWTITAEYQDVTDGELLSDIDVFLDFVDNSEENGTTTATETLFTNIAASAFSQSVNGLPETTFSIGYGEALNLLGVPNDPASVTGGDQINIRLAVNLTDGRSFTDVDATGNVSGGSFFSSPYAYRANIVCPPTVPTPGTWSIEMQDSFGDGWNDASLDVTIDGTTTQYTFTTGGAASFTFDVPTGTEVISIIFTSGDFDEEVTAQVTSANGNEVVDLQPSPAAGVELLDYCLDNL